MSPRRLIVPFLLLGALLACSDKKEAGSGEPRAAGSSNGRKQASDASESGEARKLSVALPQRRDLQRTMEVPGTITAYFEATLYAQVAGYVKAVNFDKGDRVREGEVIAEIFVPELVAEQRMKAAQLEQARAAEKRAQVAVVTALAFEDEARAQVARADALSRLQSSIYERSKLLRGEGDISIQDLEVAQGQAGAAVADVQLARARLEAASAQVSQARVDVDVALANADASEASLRQTEALLAYAKIRAPFDCIVTARYLHPGALVQRATHSDAAQPIVRVVTPGRVRLDLLLPEAEVAYVHSGTKVVVTTTALPGRRFEAELTRVASELHLDSRTELCEAELPNEDGALLPGLYVKVTIKIEEHGQAVIVPPEALTERGEETFAFVVEDGRARKRSVEKGWEFGDYVEVRKGLSPEDQVVLGAGDLRDGDKVAPVLTPWSAEHRKKGGRLGRRTGGAS